MYKKMDEIMEIMHQIGTYLSDYATAEMNGKKITKKQIENNKILETLFIRVQKAYRELQKLIYDDIENINIFSEISRDINEGVTTEILDMQKPESLRNIPMADLNEYLENAYIELRYISVYNDKGEEISSSIYKNTKFEALRDTEYDLQCENLDYITIRNNIKNSVGEFSFKEKGYILSYMAECKFYDDYAFKQINKYISDLAKKSTNMHKETYEYLRNNLIEQKYILYFCYLNNKYNGILQENDIGKLAVIKNYINEGLETMLLRMLYFDIEENIKVDVLNYKDGFKETIKSILERENSSSNIGKKKSLIKVLDKKIKNTIKEGKDKFEIEDKSDNEK